MYITEIPDAESVSPKCGMSGCSMTLDLGAGGGGELKATSKEVS